MKQERVLSFSLWILSAIGLASLCQAQSTNATIRGLVFDSSGAVIPGAMVRAINAGTNFAHSSTTNNEGAYILVNLPPGRYRMEVSTSGFKTLIKPDIVLNVQDAHTINFTLQIGEVSETVTVEGGAPPVNSQSGSVGTVVDRQFVENLPLNGRSFQSLIALTPGVILMTRTWYEGGQFSINGQRGNANYFMVDGAGANFGLAPIGGAIVYASLGQGGGGSLPGFSVAGGTNSLVSVDALQEFQVQTSTYSAEFGRGPGGQVSMVTRSGTNQFHGTLFDYFRNEVLDANDWFANRSNLKKAPLRQNDFGGVFGGPIIKNKTFFFFSYEGLRLRLPKTIANATTPSLSLRASVVPSVRTLLAAFPLPDAGSPDNGAYQTYTYAVSDPSSLDATSIRVDHSFGSKLTLFGRFNEAPSENVVVGPSNRENQYNMRTLTLGTTWVISQRVSNDLRANYSRAKGWSHVTPASFKGAVPPPESAILPPFASLEDSRFTVRMPPPISWTWQIGRINDYWNRQLNLVDNLIVSRGKHEMKSGIDYRYLSPLNGATKYSVSYRFATLADLQAGRPSVSTSSNDSVSMALTNLSLYIQDTWKVIPRLTLTYGLRWDVNTPPSGKAGKDLYTFDGLQNPDPTKWTLAPKGTPLWGTTYRNFAPRIGLAYQLLRTPRRETVVRGGFGTFYDLGIGESGLAAGVGPYTRSTASINVPSFPADPSRIPIPPFNPNGPYGYFVVADRDLQLPYTYQWNLSLEQALGASQRVTVSYVGSAGRRLLRLERFYASTPVFTSSADITRNAGTSDYNSLQLQFQRRLSKGLQALASYTWAHSIDTNSSDTDILDPLTLINLTQERGNSAYDIRHNFTVGLTYEIPAPATNMFSKVLLHNWSVDTLFAARTGFPVDQYVYKYKADGSAYESRPDRVAGVPFYIDDPLAPGHKRINNQILGPLQVGAFLVPPQDREGTLPRNGVPGLGAWQMDFALRRQFKLTERFKLQYRAEMFNLFNHPNFGPPSVGLTVLATGQLYPLLSTWGTPSSMLARNMVGFNSLYQMGGPRSIQFALKLSF